MPTNRPAQFQLSALRFHVKPRYTPGSPGIVRDEIAKHLIRRETDMYNAMINGVYGADKKAQARRLGLRGIVEERWEFRGIAMFYDSITGDSGRVPDEEAKTK